MKKVFAGVVLPVVAAAAIIGSGFSVWFFGENEVKTSADASVEVTNLLRIGTLEMKSAGKLVLDQTAAVRKQIADTKTGYNQEESKKLDGTKDGGYEARGIYFTKGNGDFDGTISYTSPENNYMDEITNVAKLQIITRITVSDNLASFIDIVPGKSANVTNVSTDTEKKTHTYAFQWKATAKKINLPVDGNDGDITFNYAKYDSQYSKLYTAEGAKRDSDVTDAECLNTAEPHTTDEYKILVEAAKNGEIKFVTTATIIAA